MFSEVLKPLPLLPIKFAALLAASNPQADPPDRTIASMVSTRLYGFNAPTSLVPGAPPLTSAAAVLPIGGISMVVPVPISLSSALPTNILSTSVIKLF